MRIESYINKAVIDNLEKIAVKENNKSYSYRELKRKSDYYFDFIKKTSCSKSVNIIICMKKSFNYIALIYAILRNKSTYIPLDHAITLSQLKSIINSTDPCLIFSDVKCPAVDMNSIWVNIYQEFPKIINNSCSKGNPNVAYILFTSGTTGKPKGIEISHKACLSFVQWSINELKIESQNVFSSHAPFTFDLSVFDIFASLLSGGAIAIMPPGINAFLKSVEKYIIEEKISIWYSVPSIIMKLLDRDCGQIFKNVKILIYAGESMPVSYAKRILSLYPQMRVYNFYGPTETNVITYYRLANLDNSMNEVPIGYACPYATIRIMDNNVEIVENGGIGELCVKTETIMQGYHNGKPFLDEYYRTGDLVKIVNDKCYEFIGRIDNMVKVNGFRVELEEIDRAMEKHPLVKQSSAYVVKEKNKDIIKANYVSDGELSDDELRQHLSKWIQSYKIPEQFTLCRELKLNERGKKVRI